MHPVAARYRARAHLVILMDGAHTRHAGCAGAHEATCVRAKRVAAAYFLTRTPTFTNREINTDGFENP